MRRILVLLFIISSNSMAQDGMDSLNITLATKIPIPGCRSIQVRDNIAFIGTDSNLQTIDLSTLQSPQYLYSLPLPSAADKLAIKDSLIFVLTRYNGLRIVSISNASHLVEINYFNVNRDTVAFVDFSIQDSLVFISHEDYGLRIINISDIHNIIQVTEIPKEDFPTRDIPFGTGPLCVYSKYCYIADNLHYGVGGDPYSQLIVIDFSDLSNPVLTSDPSIWTGERALFMSASDDFLYVLDYAGGFQVYSISPITGELTFISLIDDLSTWYGGLYIKGDYAFVAIKDLYEKKLRVYNISDETNLRLEASFESEAGMLGVFVDEFYIYMCGSNDSLYVLNLDHINDIAQKGNPVAHQFILYQNYPNPFNPVTNIEFYLDKSQQVELSIYSIDGRLVGQLISSKLPAGKHRYTWNASGKSSGIYIYQLKVGERIFRKKCILMK